MTSLSTKVLVDYSGIEYSNKEACVVGSAIMTTLIGLTLIAAKSHNIHLNKFNKRINGSKPLY
jgi:hypothetical protein